MTEEQYLLTCLAEECAEVAHAASKAIRFGMDSTHGSEAWNNNYRLCNELTDLMAVADMLGLETSKAGMTTKQNKVGIYMAHSRSIGRLEQL